MENGLSQFEIENFYGMVRAFYPNAKVDRETCVPTVRLAEWPDKSVVYAEMNLNRDKEYRVVLDGPWTQFGDTKLDMKRTTVLCSVNDAQQFMSELKGLERTLKIFDKEL